MVYVLSGSPARCRLSAVPCCAKPAKLDRNVDHRTAREVHSYPVEFGLRDTSGARDFILHCARNTKYPPWKTREWLMSRWVQDPNGTAALVEAWANAFWERRSHDLAKTNGSVSDRTASGATNWVQFAGIK
jgi:hypothetical protein